MGTEKHCEDDHDHDKDCRDRHDRCCDHDHDDDHDHDHDDCKDRDRDDCKKREHCKRRRDDCNKRDRDDCRKERDHERKDRHSSHHIHEMEKTIKALADGMANLGRGSHLQELQRIIHWCGWTSPAELAFVNAILDHISVEVRTLERLQADLVEASRKVAKDKDKDKDCD
jgi:hypothetical protein